MNPLEKINSYKDSFTKSEYKIIEYINNNPLDIIQLPIVEIAKRSNTSKSAIIRLCQKIGYDGFSEFKFNLSRYLISNNQNTENTNPITSITSLYIDYINKINLTLTINDINTLCELMINSDKIKILGYNRTGFSANQLRYRLSKIGFDAEAITDPVLMNDCANNLCKNDLCIIFSIKASKHFYLNYLKTLKENNCKVVLITMTPRTPLKTYCNFIISLPHISKLSEAKFLDDQAIYFVFIEIILSTLAKLINQKQ